MSHKGASENRGLSIDQLTIGVSSAGVETYIDRLKAKYLESVKSKIDDITEMERAFDKGWQGVSRDRFEELFRRARNDIKWDLNEEFASIRARLNELAYDYLEQDEKMIN